MQSKHDAIGNSRQGGSCEIIQEIYGFGAHYLLRVDEEQLFQRLVAKHQKRGTGARDVATFESSIRGAISRCKAELTTGSYPARKEALLSSTSRATKGTADKDGADSYRVSRKIHLG